MICNTISNCHNIRLFLQQVRDGCVEPPDELHEGAAGHGGDPADRHLAPPRHLRHLRHELRPRFIRHIPHRRARLKGRVRMTL